MKAFIFDMDGVIIDSEPLHNKIVIDLIHDLNIIPDERYLDSLCGLTITHIFNNLKKDYNLNISVEDTVNKYDRQLIERTSCMQLEAITGIPELLLKLQKVSIPTAVASSSPMEFIKVIINNLNLNNYFQFLLSGDEVEHGKPAPDIYLTAAKRLDVLPSDCFVLEDSHNGATAAKRAGMTCIGFQNPNSGKQDLSIADVLVNTITQIDIDKL